MYTYGRLLASNWTRKSAIAAVPVATARDAHEEGVECQQRDEPPLAGTDIERRREAIDQARVPTTGCVRLKRAVGGAAPTSVGSDR